MVIACTWMPKPYHLIMYTCDYLSTPTGFILRTRWVIFVGPEAFHSSFATLRATQVVWTQTMATWDMWYIDEGFLVWIIPLTYQSRESIIWAYITSFIYTCIYRMFNVFIACLFVLKLLIPFLCMLSDSDLSINMYLLHFEFTVVPLIFFILLVIPVPVCLNHIT